MNVSKKPNVDCFQIVLKLYFTHNATFRRQNVWLQKVAAGLARKIMNTLVTNGSY